MSVNNKELINEVCNNIKNVSREDLEYAVNKADNEFSMSEEVEEAIKQLESLKLDRESFLENDKEHDEVYLKDIKAIEIVLNYIKDSTPNSVIREKKEELKSKSGGNVFHIQQTINAEIALLEEILEEGEK